MTNNDNNQEMGGEPGVNESPVSEAGNVANMPAADPGQDDPNDDSNLGLDTITPEEIRELQGRAAKADENWDKYLRLTADFENFKKRAARERSEAIKYANEALIEKLLPIVDNFEAALNAMNAPSADLDSVRTGVSMIYSQIKTFLTENGAEEIDATGRQFDPNLHEAVSQQPSEEVPEGQVVQQMRKGYKLRERLIRPAMVVVAKKP